MDSASQIKLPTFTRVWLIVPDLAIRQMIVARLTDMGYQHNRWHVAEVLAALLTQTKDDPQLAMAVRDGLGNDRRALEFLRPRLNMASLPQIVRQKMMP